MMTLEELLDTHIAEATQRALALPSGQDDDPVLIAYRDGKQMGKFPNELVELLWNRGNRRGLLVGVFQSAMRTFKADQYVIRSFAWAMERKATPEGRRTLDEANQKGIPAVSGGDHSEVIMIVAGDSERTIQAILTIQRDYKKKIRSVTRDKRLEPAFLNSRMHDLLVEKTMH